MGTGKLWGVPSLSSQPWFGRWEAFKGKAFPHPLPPGQAAVDQANRDTDAERRLIAIENAERNEKEYRIRHMRRRRREKTGRR